MNTSAATQGKIHEQNGAVSNIDVDTAEVLADAVEGIVQETFLDDEYERSCISFINGLTGRIDQIDDVDPGALRDLLEASVLLSDFSGDNQSLVDRSGFASVAEAEAQQFEFEARRQSDAVNLLRKNFDDAKENADNISDTDSLEGRNARKTVADAKRRLEEARTLEDAAWEEASAARRIANAVKDEETRNPTLERFVNSTENTNQLEVRLINLYPGMIDDCRYAIEVAQQRKYDLRQTQTDIDRIDAEAELIRAQIELKKMELELARLRPDKPAPAKEEASLPAEINASAEEPVDGEPSS